jgi:putative ABC transport system substrate-binding protein
MLAVPSGAAGAHRWAAFKQEMHDFGWRLAYLLNESNPAHAPYRASAQRACAALNIAAVWVVAGAPAELAGAVEQIVSQRSQAVAVVADSMYFSESVKLQKLMQTTRLPVAYGHAEHVVLGGLFNDTSDFVANFRYAARYVDKILKGAKPADLPVDQPTKFDLAINLYTAKALGLTIPQSLLLRADEVIQ